MKANAQAQLLMNSTSKYTLISQKYKYLGIWIQQFVLTGVRNFSSRHNDTLILKTGEENFNSWHNDTLILKTGKENFNSWHNDTLILKTGKENFNSWHNDTLILDIR